MRWAASVIDPDTMESSEEVFFDSQEAAWRYVERHTVRPLNACVWPKKGCTIRGCAIVREVPGAEVSER